ncbi:hypothetical protein D3C80_2201870 [compost metagenome]
MADWVWLSTSGNRKRLRARVQIRGTSGWPSMRQSKSMLWPIIRSMSCLVMSTDSDGAQSARSPSRMLCTA